MSIGGNNHLEHQNHGQQHAVDDLRGHHNLEQVDAGHEHQHGRDANDGRNNAAIDRGLVPAAIGTALPAKCLADSTRRNTRQHTGGQEARRDQARGEQHRRPLARDGLQRASGVGSIANLNARGEQYRTGRDDNKAGNDIGGNRAAHGVDTLQHDIVLARILIDHVVLRQEDHPRCDGGTDRCDHKRHVTGVVLDVGHNQVDRHIAPAGTSHKCSDNVGHKHATHQQQNLLDALEAARHGKHPNQQCHQRHRDARRHAEEGKTARDTRKLRNGHGRIGDQQRRHGQHAPAHAKALADERRQALACDAAATRRSLLCHDEQHGHDGKHPQHLVAIAGTGTGIRGDAAGVIARKRRQKARAHGAKDGRDGQLLLGARLLFRVLHATTYPMTDMVSSTAAMQYATHEIMTAMTFMAVPDVLRSCSSRQNNTIR
ncbi:putative uncharacterized protein [Collinsella sp. CAG:166]|nr:putative uncharacterized protein [Collinsella sp. CAG:166]